MADRNPPVKYTKVRDVTANYEDCHIPEIPRKSFCDLTEVLRCFTQSSQAGCQDSTSNYTTAIFPPIRFAVTVCHSTQHI